MQKEYQGVYTKETKAGLTYYIFYKLNGTTYNYKVGTKKEGWTSFKAKNKRDSDINELKNNNNTDKVIVQKKEMSLEVIYEKYKKDRILDLKPRSLQSKDSIFKKYKEIHKKDIRRISKEDILKVIEDDNKIKKKSNKTNNDTIDFMSCIYNFTTMNVIDVINQAKKIKKLEVNNDRERYLSLEEIKQLIDAVKHDQQLLMYVKISIVFGIRLSESVSIIKEDISITKKEITIRNHKKERTYKLPIPNNIIEDLKYRRERMRNGERLLDFYTNKHSKKPIKDLTKQIQRKLSVIMNNLFNIVKRKELMKELEERERHTILKDLKNLNAKLNIYKDNSNFVEYETRTQFKVVLHTLRHTAASHMIEKHDIYSVKTLLNHASVKTTERYTKARIKSDALDDIIEF